MKRSIFTLVIVALISGVALGICDCENSLISKQEVNSRSFDSGNDISDNGLGYNQEGIYTITSGTVDADSDSSWIIVIDRDGTDGGHLTVKIDSNIFYEYTVYTKAQGGGTGHIADLEPGDVFIEWDEDPGHGSRDDFSFSGGYIAETPSYVQVTGVGSTNWVVYKVTSEGTLIKTDDCCVEHDAIHLKRYLVFEKTDDVNDFDCLWPGDEINYTIDYNYPAGPNLPDINDVNIIEYLPDEVAYCSSNPLGLYDCNSHTVNWSIQTIKPGDANCFMLRVRVRCPVPGSTIKNKCELRSADVVLNSAYEDASICEENYLVIDDMEDYTDRDSIRTVWHDGYPSGSSGSNITTSTEIGGPVYGGVQAMAYYYDNDGNTFLPGYPQYLYDVNYYSEAYADTNGPDSLEIGTDWTLEGFKSLSLWFHGVPDLDGSFDPCTYTIEADGWDIGGESDGFHYAYKVLYVIDMTSPASITVRVDSIEDTSSWAKAGVMIRNALGLDSKHATVVMTAGNGVVFKYRYDTGGDTESYVSDANFIVPHWVRLTLDIDGFYAEHANDVDDAPGPWQRIGNAVDISPLADDIYIGLCVTSHKPFELCTAEFSNVSMEGPISEDWQSQDIGVQSNTPESMYVVLEDSDSNAIWYYPGTDNPDNADPNVTQIGTWMEWMIDLDNFHEQGVSLMDVQSMYIGFGNRDNHPTPGGSGLVYIDDIRLYPSRCLDEFRPAADFTCDCVVDYRDLKIIADEWLYTDCPEADLYEDANDVYKVEFRDFAVLADNWLEEKLWP